jgi:hypothetical protein
MISIDQLYIYVHLLINGHQLKWKKNMKFHNKKNMKMNFFYRYQKIKIKFKMMNKKNKILYNIVII